MKRTIIITAIAALLTAGTAGASGYSYHGPSANSSSRASSAAFAGASASAASNQHQGQNQGQLQGQGQGQIQGQASFSDQANKQTNKQVIQYPSPSSTYEDYTPAASAPSIDPTVPCAIPVTASAGVPGVFGSFGSAYVDHECEIRELARMGLTSGDAGLHSKAVQLLSNHLDAALAEEAEGDSASSGSSDEPNIWAFETD